MNYNQIAAQTVDFQKTAFTHWCNTVAMIQDQSVSAMDMIMSQCGLPMPKAARKAVEGWVDACQEGFKRFHSYVEGGFSSLEKHLVQGATPTPAESTRLLAEEKKAVPEKSTTLTVVKKKAVSAQKTNTQ